MNRALIFVKEKILIGRLEPTVTFFGLLSVILGLSGCNPGEVPIVISPSVVLGTTGGICMVLSFLFLAVHAKSLVVDVLGPTVAIQSSKLGEWLRANGQEILFFVVLISIVLLMSVQALAQVRIPGSDESAKLKAAGTLLTIMDVALFVWLARIFAGLCVLSAGWLIKEQKFGPAVVCVIGALIIGTSPMWVQNIFEIGGGGGVFK